MKRFGLIGAAGYVAPKHLKAIKDIGGQLIAAYDPHDSVGVLDQYFPEADFFTEFERFDRHLDKMKRLNEALDCIVVGSPNYLHDAHIRFGLKSGCHVICEKPLVLNPWNLKSLIELESESNKKVHCVYQLRNHPEILKLKERIDQSLSDDYHQVELKYVTPRGKWYDYSWKGMEEKSGGITSNIGVHLFDLLIWIFGEVLENRLFDRTSRKAEGFLKLKKAEVNWSLSINREDLEGENSFLRKLVVDGQEIDFSKGLNDLHTVFYQKVVSGHYESIAENERLITLLHSLRTTNIVHN